MSQMDTTRGIEQRTYAEVCGCLRSLRTNWRVLPCFDHAGNPQRNRLFRECNAVPRTRPGQKSIGFQFANEIGRIQRTNGTGRHAKRRVP